MEVIFYRGYDGRKRHYEIINGNGEINEEKLKIIKGYLTDPDGGYITGYKLSDGKEYNLIEREHDGLLYKDGMKKMKGMTAQKWMKYVFYREKKLLHAKNISIPKEGLLILEELKDIPTGERGFREWQEKQGKQGMVSQLEKWALEYGGPNNLMDEISKILRQMANEEEFKMPEDLRTK